MAPIRILPAVVAAAVAALALPAAAAATCLEETPRAAPRQDLALEVVALVNAHRASVGAGPLALSPALMRAALWKSNHMVIRDYFAHDDPAPPVARDPGERTRACGFSGGTWGENIAYGSSTAREVMDQWLSSPGHRANIESRDFTQIGVGVAGPARHWTQVFGAGGGAEAADPAPVAAADEVTLPEDGEATAMLTLNDQDPGGWLHVTALGTDGALALAPTSDGRGVTIRPRRNFFGTVAVGQTITDLMGQSAQSTLTVEVTPVNDAPAARSDSARLGRRARSVTISVLANDADVDGDDLTVQIRRAPRHGSARVSRGRVVYKPRRAWPGSDSFEYRVVDEGGARDEATVRIRGSRR